MERKFGGYRVVYLTKNYAIKFPILSSWNHFLCGLLANMEESFLYSQKDELEYGNLLCPIVFSFWGGFFIIMKKANVFTPNEYWDKEEEIKNLTRVDKFTTRDGKVILHNSIGELKPSSWGLLNNKIVVVDYGN